MNYLPVFSSREANGSAFEGAYDAARINGEHALAVIGKDVMVIWERSDGSADEPVRLITVAAFKALSAHAWTTVKQGNGKTKPATYAERWLADPERRIYAGLEFVPSVDGSGGRAVFYNLWRGYAVQPSQEGSCAIFKDHLLTNVCNGDEVRYRWLFAWIAQIMQDPRNKPGTAVVLRGGMGVGKTIVGQVVGSLLGRHYVYADDPRYLVGNFNMHMATCLFLQADEAVWAGDKHAEGRLKGLVTSTCQMIEAKGVDPVRINNHLRLLMTSNSDWVVPAGKDERRFAIFEVAAHCAQRHEYFGELLDEIENGGRERLLYELLQVDLSTVNLRDIPKTEALFEQKVHSLDPIEAWLFERLQAGTPTRKHDVWPEFVRTGDLVDDYIATSERVGISRRATESQFGIKFKKLMPGARPCRRLVPADGGGTSVTRATGYDLPALLEARSAFEDTLQQPIAWGFDGEEA